MPKDMAALMKQATTRKTGRQITWVEKLSKEALEFVLKLRALKKKGEYVSLSAMKKILQEEFKVEHAPSLAVIRVYMEGGYDHFLPDDRK